MHTRSKSNTISIGQKCKAKGEGRTHELLTLCPITILESF